MKATGIIRKIDDLGRVVIPKGIRRNMGIKEGDAIEICTDREGNIILHKYHDTVNQRVEAAQFVAVNADKIACIIPNGGIETFVKFINGQSIVMHRTPADEYDLNTALVYALKRAYPESQLNGELPIWVN